MKSKPQLHKGKKFGKTIAGGKMENSVLNELMDLHEYISKQNVESANWLPHISYDKTQEDKYELKMNCSLFKKNLEELFPTQYLMRSIIPTYLPCLILMLPLSFQIMFIAFCFTL